MTIYILDNEFVQCAQHLDDMSLDKMIKSIAQILCNVHYDYLDNNQDTSIPWQIRINDADKIPLDYLDRKIYDQWSQWARGCKANYLYLVKLGWELCMEYNYRFANPKGVCGQTVGLYIHSMQEVIEWVRDNVPDLPDYQYFTYVNFFSVTELPLVMPKKYIWDKEYDSPVGTAMQSYRDYYQAKLKQNLKCKRQICENYCVDPHSSPLWTNRQKPDWLEI